MGTCFDGVCVEAATGEKKVEVEGSGRDGEFTSANEKGEGGVTESEPLLCAVVFGGACDSVLRTFACVRAATKKVEWQGEGGGMSASEKVDAVVENQTKPLLRAVIVVIG